MLVPSLPTDAAPTLVGAPAPAGDAAPADFLAVLLAMLGPVVVAPTEVTAVAVVEDDATVEADPQTVAEEPTAMAVAVPAPLLPSLRPTVPTGGTEGRKNETPAPSAPAAPAAPAPAPAPAVAAAPVDVPVAAPMPEATPTLPDGVTPPAPTVEVAPKAKSVPTNAPTTTSDAAETGRNQPVVAASSVDPLPDVAVTGRNQPDSATPTEAAPQPNAPAPAESHEAPPSEPKRPAVAPEPAAPTSTRPAADPLAPAPPERPMTTPEPAPARGPVPPRELGRALTEAFRSLRQQPDGTHRMTVRLDPPELGSVHIRLVAHGDTVHVTMRSDATGATSALNAQRSDIEAVLRGEGLDLGSFDVHGEDRRPQQGQPARRGDIALDDEPETFTAAADTALRL